MVTNKGKSKLVGMQSDALVPYLIEINSPDFGIFRYTNIDSEVTFEGHAFTPASFEISPPEKTEGTVGNAKVSISAVNQEWIVRIRDGDQQSRLRLIHVLIYEEDGQIKVESIEDTDFSLNNADWDDASISWDMEYDDVMQVKVPCDTADSLNMAGCA